ncbi:MAG: hypothetical protein Hyperionvirus28_6 [Hyperionvirus sp.]|uniref:Uncharacterized protein n=1 Tax=Hyperionvirus sp. TaxID=2487770 RepID=A0A3G5ABB9_9VIRU|nr:MAG: hypothetical protein Hyperionvirus28_6 [Hyperionvirus sp.]
MAATDIYIVTIVFIGTIIYTYFYFKYNLGGTGPKSYSNYLKTLTVIIIALAALVAVSQYKINSTKEEFDQTQTLLNEAQVNWIEMEKIFINNYPYGERLYQQIYKTNKILQNNKISVKDMERVIAFEIHMCSILFQSIENVSWAIKKITGDWSNIQYGWINAWRSWFKSPIIREQWELTKVFYGRITEEFVDKLIIGKEILY